MSLNLSKMKKVAGDKDSSTFMHPSGHKMVIAHSGVSALQKEQLKKMPIHLDEGGFTEDAPADPRTIPSSGIQVASPPQSVQVDPNNVPIGVDTDLSGNPIPVQPPQDTSTIQYPPDDDKGPSPASVDKTPTTQAAPVPGDGAPPKSTAAVPTSSNNVEQAYQLGLKGIKEQQDNVAAQAKAQADAQQKYLQDSQGLDADFHKTSADFQTQQQALLDDYKNGHIDPKHYQENMSTGQKIGTAIGLILGGAAAHSYGGVNPAMQVLNNQIERDIQAQQSRQDQQKTLFGANQSLYNDSKSGYLMTKANLSDIYSHQIQLAAAQNGTAQAKAAADMASSQLGMQSAQARQEAAVRQTVMNAIQKGNTAITPTMLGHAGFMDPAQAQKEQGSVDAAKEAVNTANDIFSKMNGEQTTQNLINPESSRRMDALVGQLTPLVIDENPSKRLTTESYEKEIAPFKIKTTDDQTTRLQKQQGVLNLIKLAHSGNTPITQQYSPSSLPSYNVPGSQGPQIKTVNGIQYMRGPNGQAIPVK